jgi:hypothetical protein
LDDIPSSSTALVPSVVLVNSGVYSENLTITKDGVFIIGAGDAKIINSGADDTVTIAAAIATTPLLTVLRGLEIENTNAGSACIKVEGADTFAAGTATVITAPLVVGDLLTIGGFALTGVLSTRTSGGNDFSISGGTPTAIAAEIAAAINDTANALAVLVEASVVGPIITITAVVAGTAGNTITLVPLTVPPGGITVSGGTLTGGGAAGSLVASDAVKIVDCTLVASGVGCFQVSGDTAGNIEVRDGSFRGSSSTSVATAANCTSLRLFGVEWVNDLALSYDIGLDRPSDTSSVYAVSHCGRTNDFVASLVGEGSLSIAACPIVGDLTIGGDRTLDIRHSVIGALSLDDTTAATLRNTERGTATAAGGTPTLAESRMVGSTAFAGAPAPVAFPVGQPDTSYEVFLSPSVVTDFFAVTAKAAGSFTISSGGGTPATIGYVVLRDL